MPPPLYKLKRLYKWRVIILCIGTFFFLVMFLHLNILNSTADPSNQNHHIIKSFRNSADRGNDDYKREWYLMNGASKKFPGATYRNKSMWTISVWSQQRRFRRRFLQSYGNEDRDPFKFCSVKNCKVLFDKDSFKKADALVFNMHRIKGIKDFPPVRMPNQRYIMFSDESPVHTFYIAKKAKISQFNGIFNWTMTYVRNSDIHVPYGRTVKLPREKKKKISELSFDWLDDKENTVAIVSSNCKPEPRQTYLKELNRYIDVDIFGKCGKQKCSGSAYSSHDCTLLHQYKFYLAFENSICQEYITEKVWWNAFHHNAVPIVMGAKISDYKEQLPPKSFIHVEDFKSPKELASYIKYLDNNITAYKEYFSWKATYKILNEHGYFGTPSLHICRICEALNSEALFPRNTHNRLHEVWNKKKLCKWTKHIGGA